MNNYNVCGVLVMARPEASESVERALRARAGVEVHANQKGKLVVTVEGPNDRDFANRISAFADIPGVLSTSLVYHEIDTTDQAPVEPAMKTTESTQELRP